jgi:hypothetical protein
LRIRIRMQGTKSMRIYVNTNPDIVQTSPSQKADFLHEKFTLCRSQVKNIPLRRYKSLSERQSDSYGNSGNFPCSLIRIRIENADPDFRKAKSMRIRGAPDPQLWFNLWLWNKLTWDSETSLRISKESRIDADPDPQHWFNLWLWNKLTWDSETSLRISKRAESMRIRIQNTDLSYDYETS